MIVFLTTFPHCEFPTNVFTCFHEIFQLSKFANFSIFVMLKLISREKMFLLKISKVYSTRTVWKNEKFTIISQNKYFVKSTLWYIISSVKTVTFTKFLQFLCVNFRSFHTEQWEISKLCSCACLVFPWNWLFSNKLHCKLISRIFFK